jgi:arylformamidase
MRVIDISIPIHVGMPTYPGDPIVVVDRVSDLDRGDGSNLSTLVMSTHAGTHVDPPLHFIEDGLSVDRIPFDTLIGEVHILDVRGAAAIGPDELEAADLPERPERLLFRTSPPTPRSRTTASALTVDGARWVVERRIRLVGIDALSIEDLDAGGGTFPVHRTLLGSEVAILEGLDLHDAPVGRATLWCLPLKIRGGDGAPARAVLVVD